MLNKCNFDGLTDFHTIEGIRYKIKLQDKGPEVGSLVDEGISKPLGGSTLQNHIPRHPPCWQAEIYIFYELAARWLELAFTPTSIFASRELLLLCTNCQVRRWVHPTITSQATMVKLL